MKHLVMMIVVLCIIMLVSSCGLFSLTKGLDEVMALEIQDVELSAFTDGTYRGTYDYERWKNTLQVTVQDHLITAITIVKDVKFAKSEVSDAIISRVLEAQSLKVDTVSGSTVTSKAYLKSIELALQNK
ncbi:MAG: FMN-binding protein [Sphaerochaeta sp.]|nr:FMN-binding protein [Sphaerochaeta sp.]